jgi:hypothetical protein
MYHKFMPLKELLSMVLTSARIQEYIELDFSATYAVFSTRPAMFEYTIEVKNSGSRTLQKIALEFSPDKALLCDAKVFNALREADRGRDNLTYIETSSGEEIFAKPQKQEAFTPNERPTPTLAQAFDTIDKIPAAKGNFGDARKDVFTPNPKQAGRQAALEHKSKSRLIIPEGKEVFDHLNKGCIWEEGQAGFWRETALRTVTDKLPFPVKTACRGYRRAEFLEALDRVQSQLKPKVFRGMSPHRWTGNSNGCGEYQVDGWKWPGGYRTYLADGVLPSREFYHFITGKDLKGLPSFTKID